MRNKIRFLLKQFRRIPRGKFAYTLYLILYSHEQDNYYSLMSMITNIRVYQYWGYREVEITTPRPGFLIGKAGSTSNSIEGRLADKLETNIQITFKKPTFWKKPKNYSFP